MLRTGAAVRTSTSQSVSGWAVMGFCVFGSTWGVRLSCARPDGNIFTHLLLLKHLDDKRSPPEDVATLVDLRPTSAVRLVSTAESTRWQIKTYVYPSAEAK